VNQAGEPLRAAKSATAFRTIGEVVQEVDVPAHVLRFWETKFSQLKPLKRRGGRRYYRPEDVELLRRIRQHLYQEGYTIRGAEKLLREGGFHTGEASEEAKRPILRSHGSAHPPRESAARPDLARMQQALRELRGELLEIRALLDKLLGCRPGVGG
jgi:DNA-binding transcriptional MerR regulator